MNLPDIKILVAPGQVTRFTRYSDGNLWYAISYETTPDYADHIFEYVVPISDTRGADLLRDDKAIYHMRWIRNHLAVLARADVDKNGRVS